MRLAAFAAALALALTLLVVPSAVGSTQTVLFDASTRDGVTGLRISDLGWIVAADDFQLTQNLPVTKAEIWTTEFPGAFAWSGTLNYYVLADAGGSPVGPPLYSGTVSNATRESDPFADCCGYDEFKYSFEFDPALQLQPGVRYWLAINLPGGGTIGTTQAFWASTSSHFGNTARINGDPTFSGGWSIYFFDLAFRLLNTGDQLAELRAAVSGVGPGSSLADKLDLVESYEAAEDIPDACSTLTAFIHQVDAQSGKSISSSLATSFIASAREIKGALGC